MTSNEDEFFFCLFLVLVPKPDVVPGSLSNNSLGRGGGRGGGRGDEEGVGSCPGTPETRRRQEEVLRKLAGQVSVPAVLLYDRTHKRVGKCSSAD